MIVIGVVGGIASGKSFVTNQLQLMGAFVLDADQIGHKVLLRPPVMAEIRSLWGDSVFSNGEIDRSQLARIVFDPNQPDELRKLETITHPLIANELQTEIERLKQSTSLTHLVLDAPVMVKAGWYRVCHEIIFVDTPTEVRWQRASSRGWSREMFDIRESMQATLPQKREVSNYVVDNNGSKDETIEQLNRIWLQINSQTGP